MKEIFVEIFLYCTWSFIACLLFVILVPLIPFTFLIGYYPIDLVHLFIEFYYQFLIWFIRDWGRWKIEIKIEGNEKELIETKFNDKKVFLISNHIWALDELFLSVIVQKYDHMCNIRYVAKNLVSLLPGIGWTLYSLGTIFLCRNWSKDKQKIKQGVHWLNKQNSFWLFLFPEGTRFTKEKVLLANEYASSKFVNHCFSNVIFPRVKGFTCALQNFDEDVVIYDVTLVYNNVLMINPSMGSILFRRGGTCNIYIKRYLKNEITHPNNTKTKVELQNSTFANISNKLDIESDFRKDENNKISSWLVEKWIEKDQFLDELFSKKNS